MATNGLTSFEPKQLPSDNSRTKLDNPTTPFLWSDIEEDIMDICVGISRTMPPGDGHKAESAICANKLYKIYKFCFEVSRYSIMQVLDCSTPTAARYMSAYKHTLVHVERYLKTVTSL